MNLELHDNVTVVVGGAKGIGYAIAKAFADEGSHVALIDLNEAVRAAANELESGQQIQTMACVADVTDYAAMRDTAATVSSQFRRVDHVVYAAGTGSHKFGFPFWNLEPADWPRVVEVNLLGAVHVAHAFSPPMVSARRGTFLFISSVAGQIGSQTDPPYSAAKAGLINFAKCAARDLAEHNVRANIICPGMVKTAISRSVWQSWNDRQSTEKKLSYEEWGAEKIRLFTPLARWQEPEDIASMAVFLASAKAENITGQTINVDGGWVMHS